jgi:hypothetical protein
MSEERSSFQLAKKWLSACLETHLLCQAESNDILPTRLVKTERVGSELTARLCNGSDLSRNTKYITLSHCWGKGPQFFLQRDNMNQMEQSIPVKDLSPLFQDALIATYELGFKYIWIDSLCIVQDSPGSSDWVKESSKMHHVYGNSICNLSATGYADGQTGLLQSTQGDITDLIPPEVNFARLLGQQSDSIYTIVSSQDWDREIVDSPVNRRGWICQEQIMVRKSESPTKELLI